MAIESSRTNNGCFPKMLHVWWKEWGEKETREGEKSRQQKKNSHTTTSTSTCYKLWTEILCVNMHIGKQRGSLLARYSFVFSYSLQFSAYVSCHSLLQPMHSAIGHKKAFPHTILLCFIFIHFCVVFCRITSAVTIWQSDVVVVVYMPSWCIQLTHV